MRINVAVPEAQVDAPVLDAALESVTRLNESLLATGKVPTAEQAIAAGVRWKPEPPGDEHFDHAAAVHARGWGDCDDLAPYHAASLRHTGEDPGAKAIVYKSGPKTWHAVTQRSDGTIDDPSKWAGMGSGVSGFDVVGYSGIVGAVQPLMWQPPSGVSGDVGAYIVRPGIAMRPVRGGFQARADLPWMWREHMSDKPTPTDYAMTSLHTAPLASTALTGCINGAVRFAQVVGFSCDEHVARLCAISQAVDGADFEELAAVYGEEEAEAVTQIVGSFFGGLGRMLKKVASPIASLASKAVQFVPGIGPLASSAIDMAKAALQHHPPGHPLHTAALQTLQHAETADAHLQQNGMPHEMPGAAATAPNPGLYWQPTVFH